MAGDDATGLAKSTFSTATEAVRRSSRASTDIPTKDFRRGTQLRRMLSLSLLQCLLTASLSLSLYGILWSYSKNEALPSRRKQELDMLIISISIALSLSTASSLKADVRRLRWWLLSLHWYTPREADLMLQSDKLWCLVLLGSRARHRTIKLFVFAFLVLNLASQVLVALLGLAYNVSPADRFTLTRPGLVLIPDMSDFGMIKELGEPEYDEHGQDSQALDARRYIANRYGVGYYSLGQSPLDAMPRPGTIFNPNDPIIYSTGVNSSYTYVFYEEEPSETGRGLKVATDRSVSVHAHCDAWPVIQGGDGFSQNITIRHENGTRRDWQLPALQGPDQTMFLYDPTSESGDNWATVQAFSPSRTEAWFYSCNVTIGPVLNAVLQEHLLGVDLMRCAAPAIALQGYGASYTVYTNNTKRYQFQTYPAQTFYGLSSGGLASTMASKVAQVAVTSIAVQAQTNSGITRQGMVPVTGISLEVKPWGFVYLILGLIVGVQLLVAIASVFVANRVQVRSHNHVSLPVLPHSTQQAGSPADEEQELRVKYVPEENANFNMDFCCTCTAPLLPSSSPDKLSPGDRRVQCCDRIICATCIHVRSPPSPRIQPFPTDHARQKNGRFATYCPYCQVASTPSPLPQRLRDPPAYTSVPSTHATTADLSTAPPPYTPAAETKGADPEKSLAHDALHFLDHEHDSIASLSLRYGVAASVLRRRNNIMTDSLLLGRKTILIPGRGVSLSPRPVEGEEEELKKSKIRRMMTSCKIVQYDIALLYLEQSGYDLGAAVDSYLEDDFWERNNPRWKLGKDDETGRSYRRRDPVGRRL